MEKYLKILYELALKAYENGDVPVGSIVIHNDKIIGKGYNDRQKTKKITGHAEINAIIEAEKYLNDWRLNDCILITTLSPCKFCFEAINDSRISKVYYIKFQTINRIYPQDIYKNIYFPGNEFVIKYDKIFNDFFKKLR